MVGIAVTRDGNSVRWLTNNPPGGGVPWGERSRVGAPFGWRAHLDGSVVSAASLG